MFARAWRGPPWPSGRAARFRFRAARGDRLDGVLPRKSQGFPEQVLLNGREPDSGAAAATPCAIFRFECGRVVVDELLLLIGSELDHT